MIKSPSYTAALMTIAMICVIALGACKPGASDDKDSAPDTIPPTKPVPVRVYFTRDEKVAVVTRSVPGPAVAAGAIRELLSGPTATEASYGLTSTIPSGTRLRGVTVSDGTATIDLSTEYDSGGGTLSMKMRLAQVVYTLTQFPSVERVSFKIEGAPVDALGGEGILIGAPQTRGDYEDMTPAILVESPAPGEHVTSPLRVQGTANTFEAAFFVRVLASDGTVLSEQPKMATSGTGTRGTFDAMISFTTSKPDPGTLVVFESSARDGSEVHVVKIPVMLTP